MVFECDAYECVRERYPTLFGQLNDFTQWAAVWPLLWTKMCIKLLHSFMTVYWRVLLALILWILMMIVVSEYW